MTFRTDNNLTLVLSAAGPLHAADGTYLTSGVPLPLSQGGGRNMICIQHKVIM